ncbi:tRNA (guanine-N(7)-)-methyltransferase (tRNA(m7G46)-methyltransferase) [Ascosphaera atra]|nr:tRNA (guanine-N(7)-)-methyltransferase (tRNA(m7G46)-methyltransferase) [Ascosphaera atra]
MADSKNDGRDAQPAKRMKRQEYRKVVEQKNLESAEIQLPQKRLYRQRAHANPFSDHNLE